MGTLSTRHVPPVSKGTQRKHHGHPMRHAVIHEHPIDTPSTPHGKPTGNPWAPHVQPTGDPWAPHVHPVGYQRTNCLVRSNHELPTRVLRTLLVHLRPHHERSLEIPRTPHGRPTNTPRATHGHPTGTHVHPTADPRTRHGHPVGDPSASHVHSTGTPRADDPRTTHEVPVKCFAWDVHGSPLGP